MKKPIMFFVLAGFAAVLASMVVYSALKRKEAEVEQAKVKTVDSGGGCTRPGIRQ